MTNFEYVFSLLVILLGLGLGQVLTGLARAVNQRPAIRIGWATGLLAVWTMTEMVLFWRIIWLARDALPDTTPALFGGFLITALYYFAGALVFPDDLADYRRSPSAVPQTACEATSLDDHFMQQKGKVLGSLLAAIALAFTLRPMVMGPKSWTIFAWWDWGALAIIYVTAAIAMRTKRLKVAIACMAVLVVLDLLEPFATLIWPSGAI